MEKLKGFQVQSAHRTKGSLSPLIKMVATQSSFQNSESRFYTQFAFCVRVWYLITMKK